MDGKVMKLYFFSPSLTFFPINDKFRQQTAINLFIKFNYIPLVILTLLLNLPLHHPLSLKTVHLGMPTDINGNFITDINLLQLAKDYAYPSALVMCILSSLCFYTSSGRLSWYYSENNFRTLCSVRSMYHLGQLWQTTCQVSDLNF